MTERHGSQPSPEQSKPYVYTLPLDGPDLHYLYNYSDYGIGNHAIEQFSLLSRAQAKYGIENVRVDIAMRDGKHVAIPHTHGIYIDAKVWAEKNPVQESSQETTPSV